MKKISAYLLLTVVALSCNKNKHSGATPGETCLLAQVVDSSWYPNGKLLYVLTESPEYDDNRQVISISYTAANYNPDRSINSLGSESYLYDYDDKGVMTGYSRLSILKDNTGAEVHRDSENYEYEYINGRLVRMDRKTSNANIVTGIFAYTYQYDAAGDLTRYTDSSSAGVVSYNYTYMGGKLQGFSYTAADGVTSNGTLQLNAHGDPTSIKISGDECYIQYNDADEITREELWAMGAPIWKYEYVYDDARAHKLAVLPPQPKGMPVVITYSGLPLPGVAGHSEHTILSYKVYQAAGAAFVLGYTQSSKYFYKNNGYPDSIVNTNINGDGTAGTRIKHQYMYTGCR